MQHQDDWFYIDDADLASKATFNLLLERYNLELDIQVAEDGKYPSSPSESVTGGVGES